MPCSSAMLRCTVDSSVTVSPPNSDDRSPVNSNNGGIGTSMSIFVLQSLVKSAGHKWYVLHIQHEWWHVIYIDFTLHYMCCYSPVSSGKVCCTSMAADSDIFCLSIPLEFAEICLSVFGTSVGVYPALAIADSSWLAMRCASAVTGRYMDALSVMALGCTPCISRGAVLVAEVVPAAGTVHCPATYNFVRFNGMHRCFKSRALHMRM